MNNDNGKLDEPNLEQERLVKDDPEDALLENFNEDFVDRKAEPVEEG